jgi:hypothetical protein
MEQARNLVRVMNGEGFSVSIMTISGSMHSFYPLDADECCPDIAFLAALQDFIKFFVENGFLLSSDGKAQLGIIPL